MKPGSSFRRSNVLRWHGRHDTKLRKIRRADSRRVYLQIIHRFSSRRNVRHPDNVASSTELLSVARGICGRAKRLWAERFREGWDRYSARQSIAIFQHSPQSSAKDYLHIGMLRCSHTCAQRIRVSQCHQRVLKGTCGAPNELLEPAGDSPI